jgi:GNAT superfamily N-acetyltransferase
MSVAVRSTCRLEIRPARTAADVDAVLRGRHHVYSEETDYFQPTHDGRIYDRFDTYPDTTTHLLADLDGCVVGGVRYCLDDPSIGLPVDDLFDFSPFLRRGDRAVCGGMMFVARAAAGHGIATDLIRGGEVRAAEWAASVVVGTVNPTIERLFARLGYQPVADANRHANGLPFVPVVKRLDRRGAR